jgi:hypothetical protein
MGEHEVEVRGKSGNFWPSVGCIGFPIIAREVTFMKRGGSYPMPGKLVNYSAFPTLKYSSKLVC